MKTALKIKNTNCGSCANSIHKSLGELNGVFGVNINMITGEIVIDHTNEITREMIIEKLKELDYPEIS